MNTLIFTSCRGDKMRMRTTSKFLSWLLRRRTARRIWHSQCLHLTHLTWVNTCLIVTIYSILVVDAVAAALYIVILLVAVNLVGKDKTHAFSTYGFDNIWWAIYFKLTLHHHLTFLSPITWQMIELSISVDHKILDLHTTPLLPMYYIDLSPLLQVEYA